MEKKTIERLDSLKAARCIADFAFIQGVPCTYNLRRSTYDHVGALLADSVLQAGLNYRTVVLPRVQRILNEFPDTSCVSSLFYLVKNKETSHLLNWKHLTKLNRFEQIVNFLYKEKINTSYEIRKALYSEVFRAKLLSLNGIGHKTIDYIGCLVGIESIAVDRHIRTFAVKAGIDNNEYIFLRNAFCFAADLLSISRREFDAWIWSHESSKHSSQLEFVL